MSYLGIDYGKKRIGVAYSDESNTFAMPHRVVANDDTTTGVLMKIIEERAPTKIIVGRSIDLKGQPNKVQKDIERFVANLTSILAGKEIEIAMQDEFLTSAHVEEKNDMLDASAAALILQRYLEREQYQKSNTKN